MMETGSGQGRGWLWASLSLSGLGVLIASYLSLKRFTGGSLACSRWAQCDVVNNSLYAKLYGVPVAFIGLAGYLLLLGLALAALETEGDTRRRLVMLGFICSLGGVAFSGYLTYVELYIIEAICSWCVASATIITLLAIVGAVNFWRTAPGSAKAPTASTAARR
ncbi:MAG TPA: vitamin K epoxide reductase family protein [Candidatus Methylomirabilis sp.]|nr:vitamin K epoxide reductase family protein [Candidatus Methylomirabilis sp.]